MKIDPREIYIQRLLTIDRSMHLSFAEVLNLAYFILQSNDPKAKEDEDVERMDEAVQAFCDQFRTEKGTPTLELILHQMDTMKLSNRKWLVLKTRKKRLKLTYFQLAIKLRELEGYIMHLVRERSKSIRIVNPQSIM